jgi:hypothetical protein
MTSISDITHLLNELRSYRISDPGRQVFCPANRFYQTVKNAKETSSECGFYEKAMQIKKIAEKVVELTTGGKKYGKFYCKRREKTVKL